MQKQTNMNKERQLQGMADWRHVQITCGISESHVAEMQLHSTPFNHESHHIWEHTNTHKKPANSCWMELELEFQEIVNIEKEVKLCKKLTIVS